MELTPEHLSKLDEVVTLLLLSDDLTIAFVRCNEPVLRDALYTTIKERVGKDVFIYDIKMSEHDTNLLQLLNNTMESELYKRKKEDNKKIAFFVFGLDEAINKQKTHGISEALMLLNMMREDFLRINHAIIIWINSASLSAILKEAPDFFSWRTTVFEFDIKRKELARSITEFGETDLIFLNKQELEERWEYYVELLQSYQEKGIDDAHKFANWNHNLGIIKLLTGYPAEALNYFEKSLEFSEKLADRAGIASYSDLGQVEKAIEYYEQALVISREIGDRRGEGADLGNLGTAYSDLGQVEKAIEYYEQALVISREIGDRRGEGADLGNLGTAYSDLGQVEKAIEYYEQALVISREIGDRRGEGNHLGNLGTAYSDLGQVEKAIEYYEQALAISKKIGDRRGEGIDFGNLGNAYRNLGDLKQAIKYYEQALTVGKQIKDQRIITFCEKALANIM
jgi:G-protein signaling modulator 2